MRGLMQIRRGSAVLALVAASIGGGLIAAYATHGGGTTPVFVSTAQAASAAEALPQTMTFAPVVKRSAPAVVQISSTKVIKAEAQGRSGRGQQQNPMLDDPFFRRF